MGDWAYLVSSLRVTARQDHAPDVVRAGHTLTVLRKRSGRWQLHRDANLLVAESGDAPS